MECKNKHTENIIIRGYRKISVKELKALGYKLSDNQIPMGVKPYKYGILEVKNTDNNKEVGFCVLYSTEDKLGVVLNNSYNYYLSKPASCVDLLV